jgi:hypothetical protein
MRRVETMQTCRTTATVQMCWCWQQRTARGEWGPGGVSLG